MKKFLSFLFLSSLVFAQTALATLTDEQIKSLDTKTYKALSDAEKDELAAMYHQPDGSDGWRRFWSLPTPTKILVSARAQGYYALAVDMAARPPQPPRQEESVNSLIAKNIALGFVMGLAGQIGK